jgi:hypothetical protein
MATAAKFVQPIPIFLAYLVPLDVDATGNITAKLCEVGSEFNIFCTLVTMAIRKVDPHLKRCHQILEFSKWLPLPWKP